MSPTCLITQTDKVQGDQLYMGVVFGTFQKVTCQVYTCRAYTGQIAFYNVPEKHGQSCITGQPVHQQIFNGQRWTDRICPRNFIERQISTNLPNSINPSILSCINPRTGWATPGTTRRSTWTSSTTTGSTISHSTRTSLTNIQVPLCSFCCCNRVLGIDLEPYSLNKTPGFWPEAILAPWFQIWSPFWRAFDLLWPLPIFIILYFSWTLERLSSNKDGIKQYVHQDQWHVHQT